MKIAIIGTGRMGKALSKCLAEKFDSVILAGRNTEKTRQVASEINHCKLIPLEIEDAIIQAKLVIPTLWFKDEKDFASKYREQLEGKIYLNISVPFDETFNDFELPFGISAAETIQAIVPETHFVAGFKNTFWTVFESPVQPNGLKSDVLITSDSGKLADEIIKLFEPLPFRFVNAGPISENRTIERMTLLSRNISKRIGFYPRVSWSVWGF